MPITLLGMLALFGGLSSLPFLGVGGGYDTEAKLARERAKVSPSPSRAMHAGIRETLGRRSPLGAMHEDLDEVTRAELRASVLDKE
jgi:hypothetical protein